MAQAILNEKLAEITQQMMLPIQRPKNLEENLNLQEQNFFLDNEDPQKKEDEVVKPYNTIRIKPGIFQQTLPTFDKEIVTLHIYQPCKMKDTAYRKFDLDQIFWISKIGHKRLQNHNYY